MTPEHPTQSQHKAWRVVAITLVVFCFVFFDVIFLGASIQPSNLSGVAYRPADYQQDSWLASREMTHWGFRDVGSSYLQSEPARHFVANSWEKGQSVYWDPYTAAGVPGPEQLVDLKLSPISLLSAVLGATPASYDFSILFFMALGAAFLVLSLKHFFHFNDTAVLAAAAIYLFNGFTISNLGSQNSQPFLFAPVFLYCLLNFCRKTSLLNAVILIAAQACLALILLLPVLLTVFLCCYVLALAWHYENNRNFKQLFILLGYILAAGVLSLCLVSPVYLPVIAALTDGNLMEKYGNRRMLISDYRGMLDLISSHHYWFNFNGPKAPDNVRALDITRDHSTVAHAGLGALLIIGSCLWRKTFWRPTTIAMTCLLIYYCYMVMGLPGSATWFQLPGIQVMNTQYISPMYMLGIGFLLAYALTHLRHCFKLYALIATALLIIFWFWFVGQELGELEPFQKQNLLMIACFGVLLSAALALYAKLGFKHQTILITLIALLSIELILQINTLRPKRYDLTQISHPSLDLIKQNIDGQRMLTISRSKTLPPGWGAAFGVRQISMNSSTMLYHYEDLYMANLSSDSPFFLSLEGGRRHDKRPAMEGRYPRKESWLVNDIFLDLLGVKYIMTSPSKRVINPQYHQEFSKSGYKKVLQQPNPVYQNLNPAPLAWVVCAAMPGDKAPVSREGEFYEYAYLDQDTINSLPESFTRLTGKSTFEQAEKKSEQQSTAKDSSGENNLQAATASACYQNATVNLTRFENTKLDLEVSTKQPGILVTSETWHPGWSVFVNGKQQELLRVNKAFRGVYLPEGAHQIHFTYTATGFIVGKILALISLVLLIICCMPSIYKLKSRKVESVKLEE